MERFCDKVDVYIDGLIERYRLRKGKTHVWRSWFDISTGTYISSMSDIKRLEKEQGLVFGSFEDIRKEVKYQTKEKEKKFKDYTKNYMRKAVRDIKKGRSFVKETRERISRGDYQVGKQETMN